MVFFSTSTIVAVVIPSLAIFGTPVSALPHRSAIGSGDSDVNMDNASASRLEVRVSPSIAIPRIINQLTSDGVARAERPVGVLLDRPTPAKPIRGTEANVQRLVEALEQNSPVDHPQTKPAARAALYFSPFQHPDPNSGKGQLIQAKADYHKAIASRWSNDPARHPKKSTGDAEKDRLKFRPHLLKVAAAKFKLQVLTHVKASNEELKMLQGKEASRQSKIRSKRRQDRVAARVGWRSLGLLEQWTEAALKMKSARTARTALQKSAAHAVPRSSMAQVIASEEEATKAETEYHALVQALRPDTPGMTQGRAYSAYVVASRRFNEARSKEPANYERIHRLEVELEHFRSLWSAMRERDAAVMPATPALNPPRPRTQRSSEVQEPGTPAITDFFDSMPTPELPW